MSLCSMGYTLNLYIPGLFGGTGALRFFPAELIEFVEPPRTFPEDKPFPLSGVWNSPFGSHQSENQEYPVRFTSEPDIHNLLQF